MLTINLPNTTASRNTGQEGVFNKPREPHKNSIRHGHEGFDSVEISAEARNRLEEDKVLSLEAARMRKVADDVARMLRTNGELDDGDQRKLYRPALVNRTRDEITAGIYGFESRKVLETSAESILLFIAA